MKTTNSGRLTRIVRKWCYICSIPLFLFLVSCSQDEDITPASVEVSKVDIVPAYSSARITATITANIKLSDVAAEVATYADFRDVQAVALATDGKTNRYDATARDLESGTLYFVRFRVTGKVNSITNNEVYEFTTLDSSIPLVQTNSVYDISDKGAVVSARLMDSGGEKVTEYGICWGTNETPTTQNEHKSIKTINNDEYNLSMSNLRSNTTYYVRAYAINSKGIGYGNILSFITCGVPVVLTDEVTDIDLTSATVGGTVQSDGRSAITEKGICYGLDATPTIETAQKIVSQVADSMYRIPLVNLQDETVYYVRAYAINSIGIAYGNVRQFRTVAPELPTVVTNAVGDIAVTTATAGGTITGDGGGGISERGVCYSMQENPTILGPHTSDGFGSGSFSSQLTGLQPATQYYVRAYATNKKGVAYGEQVSFTTNDYTLPVVGAVMVENTKHTTADVSANVSAAADAPITQCGFVYATHTDPQLSDLHVEQTAVNEHISAQLQGLTANTLYYICAYAINIKGVQYGPAATFTTKAYSKPTVTTGTASDIVYTGFTIGGEVQSDGGQTVTARGICYSASTTEPTLENQVVPKGAGSGSYSVSITGLQPGTVYYARAYATNSIGTSYGDVIQVATPAYSKPTVATSAASNIVYTGFTIGGEVQSDGGQTVTARGICYSESNTEPTLENQVVPKGAGSGSYSVSVTGLQPGTVYYARAYATNSVGTAYGEIIQVTTLAYGVPTVTTTTASDIDYTSATVGGTVTADGGMEVTERGVCWNQTGNPTLTDNHTAVGQGLGAFTTSLTDLIEGQTYYVRAYATNSIGTAYGDQISFTTNEHGPLPGVFSVSATKQVRFSCGNLQYKASTNTWRFAENQWDYVGENNENRSSTYNDWIDSYGWGTSGYNDKYPYMTSETTSAYAFGNSTDITGTMYDWGLYCAISNGGSTGSWFTLSYDEFNYLLNTRSRASQLQAFATVNNVQGLILLPDNWVLPQGQSFTPKGTAANVSNIYTESQWKIMEAAGAVFLPAAGSNDADYGTRGDYWTASNGGYYSWHSTYYVAACLSFNATGSYGCGLGPYGDYGNASYQYYYYQHKSVRLVQVVQ